MQKSRKDIKFLVQRLRSKRLVEKDEHVDNQIKNSFSDLIEDAMLGYINDWQKYLEAL
tara:strand:+ start:194 stop:367 length:174 start_codon:yes stop_codon:yes gene_type:complete